MKIIVILKGKPIYTSNGLVDWWIVSKIVYRELNILRQLDDKDFDEYRSKSTIRGESIESVLKAYDVKVWKWNEVARDWYCG